MILSEDSGLKALIKSGLNWGVKKNENFSKYLLTRSSKGCISIFVDAANVNKT